MNGKQREEWLNSIWPDQLAVNHSKIRECFVIELKNYQEGIDSDYYENLYQASLYLYVIGEPSDSVLMYDAKMSNFDLRFGMDYQFMLGAGFNATITYANSVNRTDFANYLEGFRDDPDLPEISEWLKFKINYFDLPHNNRVQATSLRSEPDA